MVQELVKLHGGSVQAESRLGEDTTFIVTVPLGKAGEADANLPRLLVADDNADMRQNLARLLGELYQVQMVPNGQGTGFGSRSPAGPDPERQISQFHKRFMTYYYGVLIPGDIPLRHRSGYD